MVCGLKLADRGITTKSRGLTASQSTPTDIFTTAAVAGRSVALDVCVASSTVRGDAAQAAFDITGTKLWNCDNRAFIITLLSGRRMGDHPAVTRTFQYAADIALAATANRCRRNRFNITQITRDPNRSSTVESQFCQIHRHGQNGSSLVSLVEHRIAGDMSPLLTVDPATTTMPTPRLTQQYQTMTTTSLLSPAARSSLCSHQVSDRWVPSVVFFWVAMVFPRDFANEPVSRSPVSPFDFELENILEEHEVPWQVIGEMLAVDWTGSLSIAEVQWTQVRFPSAGSCRCSRLAASRCATCALFWH